MSIPVSIDPLGTLGVRLFSSLHLPIGLSFSILYIQPFSGPVIGTVDVELLTFNHPATTAGGIEVYVGGWNVPGSCFLNFRQLQDGREMFFFPLVFRTYGNDQLRSTKPISGSLHAVVAVSQDGIYGHVNEEIISDASFSQIDGTGKNLNLRANGLVNEFNLHSVDFSDGQRTLSFRPATKNGVSGLYELHTKYFHPIPGSIAS